MTNTVAIMQPYVFPYVGYFCLLEASDIFVFYDDVKFIKQGWINRNQILISGQPYLFTIPLPRPRQTDFICQIKMQNFPRFRELFRKQLVHAYHKAKNFQAGLRYVDDVLSEDYLGISELAISSINKFLSMLGMDKTVLRSSVDFANSKGLGQADRLIDITRAVGSVSYVNPIGGQHLYDKSYFSERGVSLSFVRPTLNPYQQVGSNAFFSGLSVIDVIMNNEIDTVAGMMRDYELL